MPAAIIDSTTEATDGLPTCMPKRTGTPSESGCSKLVGLAARPVEQRRAGDWVPDAGVLRGGSGRAEGQDEEIEDRATISSEELR